jgi:hypothetical protein
MNKEQLIQKYQRFNQWQRSEPHYVNRHADTVQHCHNCGTEFSDNYCPRCGQRAEVGRVGWSSIKENIALLWGMDSRSFVYTLFQLLTRPGYLVRDYISGRRQVSFPPVKMLVIVSLFTFIVESAFHLDNEILTLKTNIPEIDKIIKWFNDNKSWGTLFFQAFYILPTWVVFRFAPRYPRHTLPEGFFVQVFLSTLSLLLTFIDYLGLSVFENIISTFFFLIAYRQLFGYSWWGTLWRCFATALSALLMMTILLIVAFYILEHDNFIYELATYLEFLGAFIASLALILTVSYRISLSKSKKTAD